MGKPFSSELTRLPDSLTWAADLDVSDLASFIGKAHGHLLVVIGAGGSFTVAEFARLLHEERGDVAIAHTPLSFLQSATELRDSFVLIFTASGNNRDILATYEAATRREPKGILIICGKKGSKVEKQAEADERTEVFSRPLPAGKDGYLATNSLIAFVGMTLRAFGTPAARPEIVMASAVVHETSTAEPKLKPAYYLALYGGWGRPAAVDLESKLSEAGLAGVMLADYRNFAHGRHNWIDKQGEHSTVVAFVTPESAPLATKTLALLPASTRVIRLETKLEGALGSLALLLQVFQLTAAVGKSVGIDPGRPGVPGYGRRIYHLGPVIKAAQATHAVEASIARKLAARYSSAVSPDREIVTAAQRSFAKTLSAQRFGALVIDFDGTVVRPGAAHDARVIPSVVAFFEKLLRQGISICFATGRGDSIHSVLVNSIAKKFHARVFVSYYNGSLTRGLTEAPPEPQGGPHHDEFEALLQKLSEDSSFNAIAKPSNKSFQLTLKMQAQSHFCLAAATIREAVARDFASRFRVVESSHSVDVISSDTSKLTAVRLAQEHLTAGLGVLTIGDRGALQGNDYDLLTHPYSLSVDAVSSSLTTCWNPLPAGVRNVAGLLHLSKLIRVRRGSFTVSLR